FLLFSFISPLPPVLYTLSLHDALPISVIEEGSKGLGVLLAYLIFRKYFDDILDGIVYAGVVALGFATVENVLYYGDGINKAMHRSEEHTSELQSLAYLVCRLLLEKKKK